MRNLILLCSVLIMIISCLDKNEPRYHIISFDAANTVNKSDFSSGDTLFANNTEIELQEGQKMIVNDILSSQVFLLEGPSTLMTDDITKKKLQSFNDKYVSLIKENINKSDKQVRQAVLGGVFRGEPTVFNYRDGQNLTSQFIKPFVRSPDVDNCELKVYNDDELIHSCKSNIDCDLDLSSIRQKTEDVTLLIRSQCGNSLSEIAINVVSEDKTKQLEQREADLRKEKLPDVVLISYYLENKMFDKAEKLLKLTNDKSPFTAQLKRILK